MYRQPLPILLPSSPPESFDTRAEMGHQTGDILADRDEYGRHLPHENYLAHKRSHVPSNENLLSSLNTKWSATSSLATRFVEFERAHRLHISTGVNVF